MQAIQAKYLSATNHRGARVKVWSYAGSMIEGRDYELNFEQRAERMAFKFIIDKKWDDHATILGQGTLSNGDMVFTLTHKS